MESDISLIQENILQEKEKREMLQSQINELKSVLQEKNDLLENGKGE